MNYLKNKIKKAKTWASILLLFDATDIKLVTIFDIKISKNSISTLCHRGPETNSSWTKHRPHSEWYS